MKFKMNWGHLMNYIKGVGVASLVILVISPFMFIMGCMGGDFNSDLLNELKGDILYLKRDDDLIMKIYHSNANLENEQLIYAHQDSIDNHNIIDLSYNSETNSIIFTAFDDEISQWSLFELNEQGEGLLLEQLPLKNYF